MVQGPKDSISANCSKGFKRFQMIYKGLIKWNNQNERIFFVSFGLFNEQNEQVDSVKDSNRVQTGESHRTEQGDHLSL